MNIIVYLVGLQNRYAVVQCKLFNSTVVNFAAVTPLCFVGLRYNTNDLVFSAKVQALKRRNRELWRSEKCDFHKIVICLQKQFVKKNLSDDVSKIVQMVGEEDAVDVVEFMECAHCLAPCECAGEEFAVPVLCFNNDVLGAPNTAASGNT